MAGKLYWFKLQNTYFNQLVQKKMCKQKNGRDMQIIYLRMILLSLDNGGYIYYQGIYDSIEDELAEEFNESPEIVKDTIDFIIKNNMAIAGDEDDSLFIPEALKYTISEGKSAERMRRLREKRKASQSDTDVTDSDTDKDIRNKREEKDSESYLFTSLNDEKLSPSANAGEALPFTLSDCQECAAEGKVNLSDDGIAAFYDRMQKDGWKIKGKPVSNLLLAMRGFAKHHSKYASDTVENESIKTPRHVLMRSISEKARSCFPNSELHGKWGGDIPKYCDEEMFTDEELTFLQKELGIFME